MGRTQKEYGTEGYKTYRAREKKEKIVSERIIKYSKSVK